MRAKVKIYKLDAVIVGALLGAGYLIYRGIAG